MTGHARHLLASLLLLPLLAGCAGGGGGISSPPVVLDPSYYTDKYVYDNADTFLGRGINMGNYLEGDKAGCAYDGEGCWTNGRKLEEADFALVAAQGFKTVRIPVRWSQHADTVAPYTIDPTWLARVKTVVGWARTNKLKVVLNTHHYNEMFAQGADLAYHKARLHAIWSQLCDAFPADGDGAYPPSELVFELLNEPNGAVGYTQWNDIVADLTALIWTEKGQAGRKIMIGTADWGGPTGLAILKLPSAATTANTIITIHWYEPMHFTHQGADWVAGSSAWIGTPWTGTDAEQAPLLSLLDSVTTWNAAAGRGFEIFVGEFGAYAAYARPEYRKAWTAFIAREAEQRKMSWAYWEFDQGFGAFDRAHLTWRPEVLDALIPAEDRPAQNAP